MKLYFISVEGVIGVIKLIKEEALLLPSEVHLHVYVIIRSFNS